MFQLTTFEPMITGLQEALPKSIGLLPFDGGVTGIQCPNSENLFFFLPIYIAGGSKWLKAIK